MVKGHGPLGVLGTIPPSPSNALNTQGSRCHSDNEQAGTQLCTQRGSPEPPGKEEAEESDCKGMEGTPLHKGRPKSIPFLLVPLPHYGEYRWHSPQPLNLSKRRHLLITALVNVF